jgi:uncharacterized protein
MSTTMVVDDMINSASSVVGVSWPLDRSVAANPLLDLLEERFAHASARMGARLGVDPWPTQQHLDEAVRRGLLPSSAGSTSRVVTARPRTVLERADLTGASCEMARAAVGQLLLEATTGEGLVGTVLERARHSLLSSGSWVRAPRAVREVVARLLECGDLQLLLERLDGWSYVEIEEEMARHFARLPGWSAWAKWNDLWARSAHRSAVSRAELLTLSLAIDLGWLEVLGGNPPAPPAPLEVPADPAGVACLEELETAVHGAMLRALAPREPVVLDPPRFEIVTCIDVRSEPLRRALEEDPRVATFGFAGFFGVLATVTPAGEDESHESLPVLVAPTASITGGPGLTVGDDELVAAGGTLAELTHEPTAMFALAEASGFLGSPWLLARSFLPRARPTKQIVEGSWHLEAEALVDIAEGALRGMSLTSGFAPEILFLGHSSTTANNPHFATLECGACAGHGGGPNAAALAGILNDPGVRAGLLERGIDIPLTTTFLSGEHDTTREVVEVHGGASGELMALLERASDEVAQVRAGSNARSVRSARRQLDRRARDWAEARSEWGLADHAAFIVAPRSSTRGIDLAGRTFLHSYDPEVDLDGSILGSILAAPVVVAQWINATYYFSTVAPRVLGAGDKTLLNPVGDFGVIEGEDPDLRLGLPWQSVATGERPVHLPVRLLLAVEAPFERIDAAVASSEMVRQLVEGQWLCLVGRSGPLEGWQRLQPGKGWVAA